MINEIAIALIILTGLGLLFATILAVAYKKLKVYEDPRIDQVEEMLPSSNCGACGEPGCRAFAEKLVSGEVNPSKCTVSSPEGREKIADYLGMDVGEAEKIVARVLCAGGKNEAHNRADYKGGLSTCRGEAVVAGGTKECTWGCLGLGDCMEVCDFDAIHMSDDALPVVDIDKCTACGDCVDICPNDLFVLMPIEHKLLVQCRSLLEGDYATDKCSVACNACGRCAADAPPGLIEMKDNLAVINYEYNDMATPEVTRRCPTNAIVWLENDKQFQLAEEPSMPLGRVEVSHFDEGRYYQ
jgi:Na+-translocating ferredoxin:NAD+ oxidoreductase RNF subunit RnfB